jgi:F0F1-type ATP synthase assembly protein I
MIRTVFSHKVSTLLIGAGAGILLARLLETYDRSPLAIFLLLSGVAATWLIIEARNGVIFDPLGRLSYPISIFTRLLMVTGLTAIVFGLLHVAHINPIGYAYLPLLPLVVVSTALFGLAAGFFAIVLSSAIASYFYLAPIYSFWVSDLQDTMGLIIFAAIGSCVVWGVRKISSF